MKVRTQKPPTWFDWAESFIAKGKGSLASRWVGYSASSVVVLTEAEKEARSLGCGAIGVEHLLAGFLSCEGGRVFTLLHSVGLSLETVRAEIRRLWESRRDVVVYDWIPFTPRCKRVVERAGDLTRLDFLQLVEPEDLFLELINERKGVVAELFRRVGVNAASLREAVKL